MYLLQWVLLMFQNNSSRCSWALLRALHSCLCRSCGQEGPSYTKQSLEMNIWWIKSKLNSLLDISHPVIPFYHAIVFIMYSMEVNAKKVNGESSKEKKVYSYGHAWPLLCKTDCCTSAECFPLQLFYFQFFFVRHLVLHFFLLDIRNVP